MLVKKQLKLTQQSEDEDVVKKIQLIERLRLGFAVCYKDGDVLVLAAARCN